MDPEPKLQFIEPTGWAQADGGQPANVLLPGNADADVSLIDGEAAEPATRMRRAAVWLGLVRPGSIASYRALPGSVHRLRRIGLGMVLLFTGLMLVLVAAGLLLSIFQLQLILLLRLLGIDPGLPWELLLVLPLSFGLLCLLFGVPWWLARRALRSR